ncbi:MAG TPA: 2,4'-dihydroxyacetophenone dioxygenase family protein [Candidatus Sulfotelmatobacter sp.]|nr:2,4'-dihydroxyacetophenone dioxygenase family protein [Candidatus Sulfotelmatobacter sp.]
MPTEINAFDALYIPANDTPWFPYGQSGCDVQLIQADPATGRWLVKLRGPAGGNLGIHRHYGSVLALTLRGAWRYLEHDWVARTGDIIHETPGSVHTLVLVEESEVFFAVDGALAYLDSQGQTLAHEDWRSITQKYEDFCQIRGIEMVDVTRPRTFGPDRVAVA